MRRLGALLARSRKFVGMRLFPLMATNGFSEYVVRCSVVIFLGGKEIARVRGLDSLPARGRPKTKLSVRPAMRAGPRCASVLPPPDAWRGRPSDCFVCVFWGGALQLLRQNGRMAALSRWTRERLLSLLDVPLFDRVLMIISQHQNQDAPSAPPI